MTDLDTPLQYLNGLTAKEFLSEYWQKKPLLIKNAFPEFQDPSFNPLTPDELAGLAMDGDINSRIILGSHRDDKWKLEYGPFNEAVLTSLPKSHWSLLVSDVEKHLPDFKTFIEPFRFIPDWRIDDLMVSYAPKGGSVGRHTDEYDVFLLQTQGERRWQIEEARSKSDLIENLPLRLLKDFVPTQDWILEPGDMLYLPPGIAHYGVAQDDCMTWSIGFRAPSWQHLVQDFADLVCLDMDESHRYSDADHPVQTHPAEITKATLDKVREKLKQTLDMDDYNFAQWFGNAVSQQACEFPQSKQKRLSSEQLVEALTQGRKLVLNPYTRLAFTCVEDYYLIHIEGETQVIRNEVIKDICFSQQVSAHHLETHPDSELTTFLCNGFESGYWLWEDELTNEY